MPTRASDATGYTSAKKIPDQLGAHDLRLLLGRMRDGSRREGRQGGHRRRPLASHPVNRGKLCPKGLSEHYTIDAGNRAKYPLLRKNGKLVRVGWEEALACHGGALPCHAGEVRTRIARRREHRPVGHRGVLSRWASWCSSASARRITTATRRCAWPARSPATSFLSAATGRRAL